MKSTTWQDDHPWTHIEWELNDVTPYQLNWFWCNMEKGDYLWHPNQHKGFEWWISLEEAGGPLGSVTSLRRRGTTASRSGPTSSSPSSRTFPPRSGTSSSTTTSSSPAPSASWATT